MLTNPDWEEQCPEARSPRGEIHVWRMNLSEIPSQWGSLRELSADEEERARRWLREADRLRFRFGRLGLRKLLGFYLGREAAGISFRYSDMGRPELATSGPPLHFNLAHSGDLVLFAITVDGPIGIDVEKADPTRDWAGIASRYFAPAERDFLSQVPLGKRLEAFLRLWTAKEAVLKATGLGLSGGLENFSVLSPAADPSAEWNYFSFIPHPNYWASLAFPFPTLPLRYFSWNPSLPFF